MDDVRPTRLGVEERDLGELPLRTDLANAHLGEAVTSLEDRKSVV